MLKKLLIIISVLLLITSISYAKCESENCTVDNKCEKCKLMDVKAQEGCKSPTCTVDNKCEICKEKMDKETKKECESSKKM